MTDARRVALVVGVTGLAGLNLVKKMLSTDKYGKWTIYGVSRRKSDYLPPEVRHICCDLLDPAACNRHLAVLGDVTHVFFTAWILKPGTAAKVEVNGAMLTNLLDNLPVKPKHIVLQTGFGHYLDSEGKETFPTPFKESMGRHASANFFYTMQDIASTRAEENGYTWSVARPGCIIGFAPFNQFNLGSSLVVYAAICKYSARPFTFPGTRAGYDSLITFTDAELLAEHHLWQATDPAANNQAFNVCNGDFVRIGKIWELVAEYFDLEVITPSDSFTAAPSHQQELEQLWEEMVKKYGLKPLALNDVSTMWTLGLMNLKTDFTADMSKSRERGFVVSQDTARSFTKLFDYLRQQAIIPGKYA